MIMERFRILIRFPETMATIHPENPHGPTIRSSQTEGAAKTVPLTKH